MTSLRGAGGRVRGAVDTACMTRASWRRDRLRTDGRTTRRTHGDKMIFAGKARSLFVPEFSSSSFPIQFMTVAGTGARSSPSCNSNNEAEKHTKHAAFSIQYVHCMMDLGGASGSGQLFSERCQNCAAGSRSLLVIVTTFLRAFPLLPVHSRAQKYLTAISL